MDFFSRVVYEAQARASQASLRNVVALAALWCDYFGVPQPSAAVAGLYQHTDQSGDPGEVVNSIPAYVEATDHSIVLASNLEPPNGLRPPPRRLRMEWGRDGCRMERAAHAPSTRGVLALFSHPFVGSGWMSSRR